MVVTVAQRMVDCRKMNLLELLVATVVQRMEGVRKMNFRVIVVQRIVYQKKVKFLFPTVEEEKMVHSKMTD